MNLIVIVVIILFFVFRLLFLSQDNMKCSGLLIAIFSVSK